VTPVKWHLCAALCSALFGFAALPCGAQSYPTKPVRLVVPFGAGGGADSSARLVSPAVTATLGQQLVVENRSGASGTIGAAFVARAAPDGYTLLLATVDMAITAASFSKLTFHPLKDFSAITLLAKTPNILAVHPSLPAKFVKELIALARANPGKINYAAPIATILHLAAEMFNTMAKVKLTNIPYVSTAPSVIAVLSGESSVIFAPAVAILPHAKSGRMRTLAITSSQRSPAIPELPTVAESGLPGYEMETWYGIVAPVGTPEEIIVRLNGEFNKAVQTREVTARLMNEASTPVAGTVAEFSAYMKEEMSKIEKVVKAAGVRAD
jgi:tripartite-type tricarboxylate transporter receptor subunit TctC